MAGKLLDFAQRPPRLEYSLRDELDSAWAVRPLALSEHLGRTTLLLEAPGGETLDRLLPGPMEIPQFLRLAVGLATALGGLHKRELIHKDVKPANVFGESRDGSGQPHGGFALIPENCTSRYESNTDAARSDHRVLDGHDSNNRANDL